MTQSERKLLLFWLICISGCCSLPFDKTLKEMRASLVTKDNFREHFIRDTKDLEKNLIPDYFVVSSELKINKMDEQMNRRSYLDNDGNALVQVNYVPVGNFSDYQNHLNRRFKRSIFRSKSAGKKSFKTGKSISDFEQDGHYFNPKFDEYYLGGERPAAHDSLAIESRNFEQVVAPPESSEDTSQNSNYLHIVNNQVFRPVYYVEEEPDSLHADRSPYNYEPADNEASFPDSGIQFSHSGVASASQNDFVIKDHIYTMCPGCPTFTIPVPIPKASVRKQYQKQSVAEKDSETLATKNFLQRFGDRIASTMKGIQNRLMDPFLGKSGTSLEYSDDKNSLKEKKDESPESGKSGWLVAGAAAVALGGLAYFGTAPSVTTIGARHLKELTIPETIENAKKKFEN